MAQYTVHFSTTVSTAVTIEADDPQAAIEAAYDSPDMPGSMVHGAFGSASVDESGEWLAVVVTDDNGNEVWAADQATPMSDLVIYQDHEYDGDFELGDLVPSFWTKGHGHEPCAFIRAVVAYCLDNDVDIPAIPQDVDPVELWQQNIAVDGGVEYRRGPTPPTSSRTSRFPITLLDLETLRRRGSTKCSVIGCSEPWSVSSPAARLCVERHQRKNEISVQLWLCREHQKCWPEPLWRVAVVPVGATVMLPQPAGVGEPR